ncbi:hypothetical protein P389DRAFT_209163 [Cystobasidium minutum MCA 4210]|uniref:uncharacterized protein n=1 Tax=Cystobasidium minutum MCA 4210 TaxID=1397322 RepID=UPI0034D0215B|eukprot:jgi/Rhomi1/209163/estExt_Genemark1.C_2_t20475
METPTRPFTIGGQTLSQARKAAQPAPAPRPAATPVSQQKKNVSFKSSVFPSPPSYRLTFPQGQQQQPQQEYQYQHQPQQSQVSQAHQGSSNVGAVNTSSTSPQLPRSTSAPNLLPAPGTSRTSPQQRQVTAFGHQNTSQLVTSSLSQAKAGPKQTPQKPLSSSNFETVPVDPKLALEARRATMAKALRVNLAMLLAWYLITDSRLYAYGAGRLVTAYPSLRAPIVWVIGRILPTLFLYNAAEAFLAVRSSRIPDSSSATAKVPIPTQAQPVQVSQSLSYRPSLPISTGTHKSSPKTRPSTNMLPSPAMPERRLQTSNSTQGTPVNMPPPSHKASPGQMFRPENSVSESPTSALRRALLATADKSDAQASPSRFIPSSSSMPAGLSALQGSPVKDKAGPRVQAYWARNEAAASPLHRSIRTEEDIDRLVGAI